MDDFCYELFEPRDEAEAIMRQAKEDLYELLKSRLRKSFEDVKSAEDELVELNCQIAHKKRELEDITKRCEEKLSYERTRLPKEFVNQILHSLTKGFAPGDIVYHISGKYKRENCPVCLGERTISAIICGNERSVQCPECKGRGYTESYYHEIEERIVDRVDVRLCFENGKVGIWNSENVFLRGSEYHSSIGDVFSTREEAEAAVKERDNK